MSGSKELSAGLSILLFLVSWTIYVYIVLVGFRLACWLFLTVELVISEALTQISTMIRQDTKVLPLEMGL